MSHSGEIVESEDELPTPDVDDVAAGAPDGETPEPADIDDAGDLDDGNA